MKWWDGVPASQTTDKEELSSGVGVSIVEPDSLKTVEMITLCLTTSLEAMLVQNHDLVSDRLSDVYRV